MKNVLVVMVIIMFRIYCENHSYVKNYKTFHKIENILLFNIKCKSYFAYDDFDQQIIFRDRYLPIFDNNRWGVII